MTSSRKKLIAYPKVSDLLDLSTNLLLFTVT